MPWMMDDDWTPLPWGDGRRQSHHARMHTLHAWTPCHGWWTTTGRLYPEQTAGDSHTTHACTHCTLEHHATDDGRRLDAFTLRRWQKTVTPRTHAHTARLNTMPRMMDDDWTPLPWGDGRRQSHHVRMHTLHAWTPCHGWWTTTGRLYPEEMAEDSHTTYACTHCTLEHHATDDGRRLDAFTLRRWQETVTPRTHAHTARLNTMPRMMDDDWTPLPWGDGRRQSHHARMHTRVRTHTSIFLCRNKHQLQMVSNTRFVWTSCAWSVCQSDNTNRLASRIINTLERNMFIWNTSK